MAHGHYRHTRIEKLHSTRRRREIAQNDGDSGPSLQGDSSTVPALPAADELSGDCDPSHNLICLEQQINEPDVLIDRRDETTSESVTVETVLQIVDASSHILLQSTAADYPLTISESAYGVFTISGADSIVASASLSVTASVDVPLLTSPTIAPATQPTTSLVSETSIAVSSTNTTQSTTSSVSQASPSTMRVASAISSPVRMSTPLIAPSSSTHTASITSPHAYNFLSNPGSSSSSTSSTSSSWTPDETYSTSSSTTSWGSVSQTATATGTSSAPSTSETSGSGSGSSSNSTGNPDTPKIVGGVVGSVAGLALLIFLLFYYLRRRGFLMGAKGHTAISDDAAAGAGAGALVGVGAREITERPVNPENRFTASYFAPAFMKRWRQSTATMRTDSTVDSTSSERGFQKISGRKLPPVLTHGGDGFGGGLGDDSPTVPGFPPTSPAAGPVASPVSPAPPPASPYGMPLDSSYTREIQEHAPPPSRPGPAHIPVSNSVNVAYPITITPAQPLAQPQSAIPFIPPRPDGLGRSLHSHDGSRSSRFTEGIDM
ncbi:unnamed protein product [Penicillium salamii]|nr:unnamed protein product [Penicillium salamii]CAG8293101.1 unnamed protein product [Penicillium salamii]CAG8400290.1 unnamed protein product [Penicillium salamii]